MKLDLDLLILCNVSYICLFLSLINWIFIKMVKSYNINVDIIIKMVIIIYM